MSDRPASDGRSKAVAAPPASRRRILFVSEAVTLAHVARPAALFGCLDPTRYDAFIACDPRSHRFLTMDPQRRLSMRSIDSAQFSARLHHGDPLYDLPTLLDYAAADRALIEQVRPDLVVGDFRLSLSISARLSGVPYATVTNAYWSPYARDRSLPLPVLPWTPYVPVQLVQRFFDFMQVPLLASHCRPLNAARARFDLEPLPLDLRRIYTDADFVLYADSPRLFPLPDAPAHHLHLGPVLWSPPVPLPLWWGDLPEDRPLVYVTMGSSGSAKLLDAVIDGLAGLDLTVVASTAGAPVPQRRRPGVWFAEYLPGEQVAARSAVVVCNGGSPTSQQALAAGAAVLGICENMDQMLNMRGLAAGGAGIGLRADRLSPQRIADALGSLLKRVPAARAESAGPAELDFKVQFARFVDGVFGG